MEIIEYITTGTCCKQMRIEVEDDIVKNVEFMGGCHGNLQGIARLVVGMNIEEVRSKLKGIRCGAKSTSCPDQLATCLEQYMEQKHKENV